jgi:hypothetical protein
MAILATGQQIWDQAVEYADMTGSQFPNTTTFGLTRVNTALSRLHYHLANGDNDWFAEQAYFQAVAGTEFFPLPTGIVTDGSITWTLSLANLTPAAAAGYSVWAANTVYAPAATMKSILSTGNYNVYTTAVGGTSGIWLTAYQRTSADITVPKKFYRMTKLYLHVGDRRFEIPKMFRHETYGYKWTPSISGYLDMLYVPEFVPLTALSSAVDTTYPAGWEDYCAWLIARQLSTKEESMEAAQMAGAEAGDLLREIDTAVASRDASYPQRIEDTTGRWQWARRFLLGRNYQNNYEYRIEGANLVLAEPAMLP